MAEATNDAMFTKLQAIQITKKKSVVEFVYQIDFLVPELLNAGHNISDAEKRGTRLRGLQETLGVITKIIHTSEISFTEVVSNRIIEESI